MTDEQTQTPQNAGTEPQAAAPPNADGIQPEANGDDKDPLTKAAELKAYIEAADKRISKMITDFERKLTNAMLAGKGHSGQGIPSQKQKDEATAKQVVDNFLG